MLPRWIMVVASLSGFLAVAIGAFGAHGLPERLKRQNFDEATIAKKLDQCEIGVRYQAYHALAMLAIGLSPVTRRSRLVRSACGMFLAGILFFSGGLYSMALLNIGFHWSIVPIGGLMYLLGWFLLGLAAIRFSD